MHWTKRVKRLKMPPTEPDWRKIWNVLHEYSYGRLDRRIALARLEIYGLSKFAAEFRIGHVQPDGLYEISRRDYTDPNLKESEGE